MATQNDIAWQRAFQTLPILENVMKFGFYDIEASELKRQAGREPRHLAKIDYASSRPKIFVENNLNILAISNSSYRIGNFNPFFYLPERNVEALTNSTIETPTHLQTLANRENTSENAVVYTAYSSKMIDRFCNEDVVPTLSGRMRTKEFSFNIESYMGSPHKIDVKGAQIEIDAGFEGPNSVYLFEVKNNLASSFNLRQLYYPYITWKSLVNKPVKNIFLTHSNNCYDFFEIEFVDPMNISSAKVCRYERFSLGESTSAKSEVEEAIKELISIERSDAPFPQADSFERILDLVAQLKISPKTKSEIAEDYDFDLRQSDYYLNAAKYLGLIQFLPESKFGLSALGDQIFAQSNKRKLTLVAGLLLDIPIIKQSYDLWISQESRPNVEQISAIMDYSFDTRDLSPSTKKRRAQTVLSWTVWLRSHLS